VYDPSDAPPAGQASRASGTGAFTAVSPAGRAVEMATGQAAKTVLLTETGFYDIRPAAQAGDPIVVAVNGAVAESDLTPMEPAELAANVTPAGTAAEAAGARDITVEEQERHQSLWWYLLATGLLLLVIEAVVASRLPRIA